MGIYNKEISNQLLWSFIDFIKLDSTQQDLRFQYCLQGAQLAIRSGLHLVAIELLDHLVQNDTDEERISKGMFLLANEYAKEITSYLTVDPLISSSINERIDPVTIHKIDHLKEADQLYRKLIKVMPIVHMGGELKK